MTPHELLERLTIRGYPSRIRKDEVQIQSCVYCGNPKWNLTLSGPKGIFRCWACNAGGRLDKLLKEIISFDGVIRVNRNVEQKDELNTAALDFKRTSVADILSARTYLERRNIDADRAAQDYGLAVSVDPSHFLYPRIVIPVHHFKTGTLKGWVGRTYTRQVPKYLSTLTTKITGGYRIATRDASIPCVIVEGPFDAFSVHRAGFNVAVLYGTDAPADLIGHIALLASETPVCIMLDGTATAEAMRLYAIIENIHARTIVCGLPNELDPGDLRPQVLKAFVQQKAQLLNH